MFNHLNSHRLSSEMHQEELYPGVSALVSRLKSSNMESKGGASGSSSGETENSENQDKNSYSTFPSLKTFQDLCQNSVGFRSIRILENLVVDYIKIANVEVEDCWTKPNRAAKLKKCLLDAITFFHFFYQDVKDNLEHSVYLDKMSDLISMYMDMEIRSSKRGREVPKKIAARITSILHSCLDRSEEHMLDSVLQCHSFTKDYKDVCIPILSKLLSEVQLVTRHETRQYLRLLLSFKLWKNVVQDFEEKKRLNKLASEKLGTAELLLTRPKDLNNILPKIPKKKKNITLFLMVSKFNLKDACQAFIKYVRETQHEYASAASPAALDDSTYQVSLPAEALVKSEGGSSDLLNSMISSLAVSSLGDISDLMMPSPDSASITSENSRKRKPEDEGSKKKKKKKRKKRDGSTESVERKSKSKEYRIVKIEIKKEPVDSISIKFNRTLDVPDDTEEIMEHTDDIQEHIPVDLESVSDITENSSSVPPESLDETTSSMDPVVTTVTAPYVPQSSPSPLQPPVKPEPRPDEIEQYINVFNNQKLLQNPCEYQDNDVMAELWDTPFSDLLRMNHKNQKHDSLSINSMDDNFDKDNPIGHEADINEFLPLHYNYNLFDIDDDDEMFVVDTTPVKKNNGQLNGVMPDHTVVPGGDKYGSPASMITPNSPESSLGLLQHSDSATICEESANTCPDSANISADTTHLSPVATHLSPDTIPDIPTTPIDVLFDPSLSVPLTHSKSVSAAQLFDDSVIEPPIRSVSIPHSDEASRSAQSFADSVIEPPIRSVSTAHSDEASHSAQSFADSVIEPPIRSVSTAHSDEASHSAQSFADSVTEPPIRSVSTAHSDEALHSEQSFADSVTEPPIRSVSTAHSISALLADVPALPSEDTTHETRLFPEHISDDLTVYVPKTPDMQPTCNITEDCIPDLLPEMLTNAEKISSSKTHQKSTESQKLSTDHSRKCDGKQDKGKSGHIAKMDHNASKNHTEHHNSSEHKSSSETEPSSKIKHHRSNIRTDSTEHRSSSKSEHKSTSKTEHRSSSTKKDGSDHHRSSHHQCSSSKSDRSKLEHRSSTNRTDRKSSSSSGGRHRNDKKTNNKRDLSPPVLSIPAVNAVEINKSMPDIVDSDRLSDYEDDRPCTPMSPRPITPDIKERLSPRPITPDIVSSPCPITPDIPDHLLARPITPDYRPSPVNDDSTRLEHFTSFNNTCTIDDTSTRVQLSLLSDRLSTCFSTENDISSCVTDMSMDSPGRPKTPDIVGLPTEISNRFMSNLDQISNEAIADPVKPKGLFFNTINLNSISQLAHVNAQAMLQQARNDDYDFLGTQSASCTPVHKSKSHKSSKHNTKFSSSKHGATSGKLKKNEDVISKGDSEYLPSSQIRLKSSNKKNHITRRVRKEVGLIDFL